MRCYYCHQHWVRQSSDDFDTFCREDLAPAVAGHEDTEEWLKEFLERKKPVMKKRLRFFEEEAEKNPLDIQATTKLEPHDVYLNYLEYVETVKQDIWGYIEYWKSGGQRGKLPSSDEICQSSSSSDEGGSGGSHGKGKSKSSRKHKHKSSKESHKSNKGSGSRGHKGGSSHSHGHAGGSSHPYSQHHGSGGYQQY
jgi:hypothetical protein